LATLPTLLPPEREDYWYGYQSPSRIRYKCDVHVTPAANKYAKLIWSRRHAHDYRRIFSRLLSEQMSHRAAARDLDQVSVYVVSPLPTVKERFSRLADEWSRDTMHISSASDLINDKRYQEIIALGWDVVPHLLTDIQKNKRFWFPALASITGLRPFDPGDSSNPRRMTEAWVRWGKRKGLI